MKKKKNFTNTHNKEPINISDFVKNKEKRKEKEKRNIALKRLLKHANELDW